MLFRSDKQIHMKTLKNVNPSILVIGDFMIDHDLWGSCQRISPEAPVQIVDIKEETTVLGGAGNVVNNLKALGAKVSVSSVLGDDDNAKELLNLLEKIEVDTKNIIIEKDRKTSKKSRVIATSQQVLRYDNETKEEIDDNSIDKIIDSISNSITSFDSVILSDYSKGVLTYDLCQKIITLCKKNNIKVFVEIGRAHV